MHTFFHNKEELDALDKREVPYLTFRAEVEKRLAGLRTVLGKVAKLGSEETASLRAKLTAVEEVVGRINDVIGRIDRVRKVYSGEAKPEAGEMKEDYDMTNKQLRQTFKEAIEDWQQTLGARFFQLLPGTKDFRSILMYIELARAELVMVNIRVDITKTVGLKEHGVKSCRTFSVLGGPSLQRFDNKVYLIGGYDRTTPLFRGKAPELKEGVSDALLELEFSGEKFIARNLPVMIHARYDIGSATIKKSFIYAVTGTINPAGSEIHVKYNERYDIAAKKWVSLSPVNVARAVPGICPMNDRYIYIYGGQMDGNASGSALEVYDTLDDGRGWQIVNVPDQNILGPCDAGTQTQISDSEYILAYSNGSFAMSATGESVKLKSKLNFALNYAIFYRPVWLEGHRLHFVSYRSDARNVYNLLTHEFSAASS